MKLRALAAAPAAVCMSGQVLAEAGPRTGSNTLQCPPYQVIGGASYPTGDPCTAAADRIITDVSDNDINMLNAAGRDTIGVADVYVYGYVGQ